MYDDTKIIVILNVSVFRDDASSHVDDTSIKKSKIDLMVK